MSTISRQYKDNIRRYNEKQKKQFITYEKKNRGISCYQIGDVFKFQMELEEDIRVCF